MARSPHIIDLLPSALTAWQEQQLVQGSLDLPASEQGLQHIQRQISQWQPDPRPRQLWCGPDEASRQTAELFAAALGGVKVKVSEELREINFGLWQGLSYCQIKERYPSAYSHWRSEPALVAPPEGETLPSLVQRTVATVGRLVDKADGVGIALVLRPVILSVAAAFVSGREPLSILPQGPITVNGRDAADRQPAVLEPQRFVLDDATWQQRRRLGSQARRIPA
jgi:broad specificity phosphatase PhoE